MERNTEQKQDAKCTMINVHVYFVKAHMVTGTNAMVTGTNAKATR